MDFDKLDYDAKASFVIERVFSWGDVPDVRGARRYYGDDRIRDVLLVSLDIPFVALGLASAICKRPTEDFKSYSKGEGQDPYLLKREYFDRLHDIHGVPRLPPPDPILMRMS